jgi:hypothetical protein
MQSYLCKHYFAIDRLHLLVCTQSFASIALDARIRTFRAMQFNRCVPSVLRRTTDISARHHVCLEASARPTQTRQMTSP